MTSSALQAQKSRQCIRPGK